DGTAELTSVQAAIPVSHSDPLLETVYRKHGSMSNAPVFGATGTIRLGWRLPPRHGGCILGRGLRLRGRADCRRIGAARGYQSGYSPCEMRRLESRCAGH